MIDLALDNPEKLICCETKKPNQNQIVVRFNVKLEGGWEIHSFPRVLVRKWKQKCDWSSNALTTKLVQHISHYDGIDDT